jgi:hypothetical protein
MKEILAERMHDHPRLHVVDSKVVVVAKAERADRILGPHLVGTPA